MTLLSRVWAVIVSSCLEPEHLHRQMSRVIALPSSVTPIETSTLHIIHDLYIIWLVSIQFLYTFMLRCADGSRGWWHQGWLQEKSPGLPTGGAAGAGEADGGADRRR